MIGHLLLAATCNIAPAAVMIRTSKNAQVPTTWASTHILWQRRTPLAFGLAATSATRLAPPHCRPQGAGAQLRYGLTSHLYRCRSPREPAIPLETICARLCYSGSAGTRVGLVGKHDCRSCPALNSSLTMPQVLTRRNRNYHPPAVARLQIPTILSSLSW